ncbi:PKD domain-containing protein [Sediminibacterium goheungense]|uniref:Gliding motility-associated-like protein n=1 Tax=Sediminibacterium goheungense TaxID=1086393 RepID=A0A4R6J0H2_9BACT|nr:PKD domain-containing protein [Sediminibacterium goheungense]TDO28633.1 gliding motility-associated-like protein [Sediminibacterium goheungense]
MKKLAILLFIFFIAGAAEAAHLKGGWIQYEYLGPGASANSSRYKITVRQYLDFNSSAGQVDAFVAIGIFNGLTNATVQTVNVNLTSTEMPEKTDYDLCLNPRPPNPPVRFRIDKYETTVELPNINGGYTLAIQRCCRINGIVNVSNSASVGVTYTTKISGIINGIDYSANSNPVFVQRDTALICFNAPFTFDFAASDADGDSLAYSFCDGVNTPTTEAKPLSPSNPPYPNVPYSQNYSGNSPMGPTVNINRRTGLISGIAPSTIGDYVVAVCVEEYRNGELIGTTRKEIHITVGNCTLAGASLKPSYITCDGFTMSFQNESTSSNITGYLWDFGESNAPVSTNPTPTHTYKDTGTYTLKLKVTSSGGCQDSTTAQVRVYPGFIPDFTVQGTCYLNTYNFKDATTTAYGVVNSWRWDLGDPTTIADTSTRKDTAWKYNTPQSVQVRLIASNSKGCVDTVVKTINILDKPIVNLAFRDTLICSIDTLRLNATVGNGSVAWVPDRAASIARMSGNNTPNPLVYPVDTTRYIVTVNDNGCINTDTVTVNVLDFIDVELGPDTSICRTDRFTLSPVSDALSYQWTTSTGIPITANTKYPTVQPLVNTTYYVTANLGYCQDRDSVFVLVAPYPQAVVRSDTAICFGDRVQLEGSIVGAGFIWSPSNSIINANTLFPVAGPSKTTQYVLTAIDTIGCDKPVSDTVTITVIPPIKAYAGRDTFTVAGRPLQLSASGGNNYLWRPTTGLDNPSTDAPIATLPATIDSIRYIARVSSGNCFAEDDVLVRVFKNGPDLYVPSAFTPNGDGLNDIVRPVGVGIAQLQHFRIYNRWGQLLYTTSQFGQGWDGSYNGVKQPAGTYVYEAIGNDQSGNRVYRKGTLVLIR